MVNRKVYLKHETEDNRTFTWKKEWISPLESPWSIFEKFRYMNELTNHWVRRSNGQLKEIKQSPLEFYNIPLPVSWSKANDDKPDYFTEYE